jgi:hypothetical protein
MTTAIVLIAAFVAAIVVVTVVLARRDRRPGGVPAGLEAEGDTLRDEARARLEGEAGRGQAKGMSGSASTGHLF